MAGFLVKSFGVFLGVLWEYDVDECLFLAIK